MPHGDECAVHLRRHREPDSSVRVAPRGAFLEPDSEHAEGSLRFPMALT
ncbi:hypothetical protein ACFPRL_31230 [Pseudoclavibacter helvolus]